MKCEVLIDWLSFTVKTDDPISVIRDYLGMDPDLFQDPGYSINGYLRCKAFSNIMVCYEGRENAFFSNMGVCVSMSGNGCRTFETYSRYSTTGDTGTSPFSCLFSKLANNEDVHITRLDVACDDHAGILDMEELRYRYQEHLIRTRCNKKTFEDGQDGKKEAGKTLYIGSKSSSFRTRIYDKSLEMGVEGPWIRVEMVMREKNGDAFVSKLVDGVEIGTLAAQVLNDKLAFINDDDSNISRCSICGWWLEFVEEVEKVRLVARCVIQHSVEHLTDWINTQVAPTLYIIAKTLGFPYVWKLTEQASQRLSPKQEALITDWNSLKSARCNTGPGMPQLSAAY